MPPRSAAHGRHRRPRHSAKPAYVTAVTIAAFTVSGMNVPSAIGQVRTAGHAQPDTQDRLVDRQAAADPQARALRLQSRLQARQFARASREAEVRSAQLAAVAAAKRRVQEARIRARNTWVVPVLRYRLTAGFGDSSALWSGYHTGQDFAAPEGTPARAVGEGKIIFAGWDGAYGLKIVIQHADGTATWYGHLSKITRASGHVLAGDVIGLVGSTGNSTGPHLHLEVRPGGGDPVAPLPWLRGQGVDV